MVNSRQRLSPEEYVGKVNDAFARLNARRVQDLERLKTLQMVKDGALRRETARLSNKDGADNPRVKQKTARLTYNTGFFQDLQVEIELAQIEVPAFEPQTWMVHGLVFNEQRQGIPDLTVSFFDAHGKYIKELGYVCTNEQGYFALIYPTKDGESCEISESEPLFLTVTDSEHLMLSQANTPLFIQIGRIDTQLIVLPDDRKVETPPEPVGDDTTIPKDTWIVKGKILSADGKSVEGVEVSLYDKDLLFDERLGTILTDAQGCFTIVYKTQDFSDLCEADPDLYVKVLDRKNKVLYSSRKTVRYKAGCKEIINIKLSKSIKDITQ